MTALLFLAEAWCALGVAAWFIGMWMGGLWNIDRDDVRMLGLSVLGGPIAFYIVVRVLRRTPS